MKKLAVVLSSIEVFHWEDLMILSNNYGFSYYKGIIVFWDRDYDTRILKVINMVEDYHELSNLFAVGETKAIVSLLWKKEIIPGRVPTIFSKDIDVEGDCWSVRNLIVPLQ